MRIPLIIAVLYLCFCHGPALADNTSVRSDHAATVITALDADTTDTGACGGIINAIKKLDAWIQQNLW